MCVREIKKMTVLGQITERVTMKFIVSNYSLLFATKQVVVSLISQNPSINTPKFIHKRFSQPLYIRNSRFLLNKAPHNRPSILKLAPRTRSASPGSSLDVYTHASINEELVYDSFGCCCIGCSNSCMGGEAYE